MARDRRVPEGRPEDSSPASFLPASRKSASTCRAGRPLANTSTSWVSSGIYARDRSCSTSGVSPKIRDGRVVPGLLPTRLTTPSRSIAVICARTPLALSSSLDAMSSTVNGPRWRRLTIRPRPVSSSCCLSMCARADEDLGVVVERCPVVDCYIRRSCRPNMEGIYPHQVTVVDLPCSLLATKRCCRKGP